MLVKTKQAGVEVYVNGLPKGQTGANGQLLVDTTIFTALGIDPYAEYDEKDIATFYRVEDHAEPIRGILA